MEVRLAQTSKEIKQAQKLRYKVFYGEMGAAPNILNWALRRDFDEFDQYCDHLLVIDKKKVVGTYRLLSAASLTKMSGPNLGRFYTEGEFNLNDLFSQTDLSKTLELGRACVHKKYRDKKTIDLLWKGICQYAQANGYRYLIGCVSFSGTSVDDKKQAFSYLGWYVNNVPVTAHQPNQQLQILDKAHVMEKLALKEMPPLMKAYLRLGASVSQDYTIDYIFNTIDVMVLVDLQKIPQKYKDKFFAQPKNE